MSRLLHYSAQPFVGPPRSAVGWLGINMKPVGLWLSVEGDRDWPEWCRAEEFGIANLACVSEIVLKPKAKVLRLTTALDIDLLTEECGRELLPGWGTTRTLDWHAIAEKHDGIIIAPYQWSRRLDGRTAWYYGFDVACGCIWRPRAIADIRPVAAPQREAA
jgi:hypothetical protein